MRVGRTMAGLVLLLPILVSLSATDVGARDAVRHITLDASTPGDGESATEVREVRLFFSGAPLLRGASVRILTSSRQLVRSNPPAADPDDPTQLFVTIDEPLAPGSYVIQWRCIADDGHVMRGDFRFEVAAA